MTSAQAAYYGIVEIRSRKMGSVLLVEYCLDEIDSNPLAQAVDLIMMTVTGGRERTFLSIDLCYPERTFKSAARFLSAVIFKLSKLFPYDGREFESCRYDSKRAGGRAR